MSVSKRSVLIAFCLFQFWFVRAGDLSKAFKYLNLGDYENAVKYFREVLQDDKANIAANYGMAKVFFAKDFKGANIDSANGYILRAIPVMHLSPDDKETKKLASLGVRTYTVGELQRWINEEAFKKDLKNMKAHLILTRRRLSMRCKELATVEKFQQVLPLRPQV
jgi:tetratricopeptide (TPR) repeat protein